MKEQPKIDINLPEDLAQGVYSNLAVITHSNAEFVVDFVAMMPGLPKANVRSRVIMTPQNAKRFLNALAENVKKFEERNGYIKEAAIEIPIIGNNEAMA
ncbi:DUF3467 domain-containing protein [Bacteroidales bacterium OttesenSCG-928-L19]|nr:DUF3467 domain-containing protein [Bacteroidales bacterium OttesenSCG-928-L19]